MFKVPSACKFRTLHLCLVSVGLPCLVLFVEKCDDGKGGDILSDLVRFSVLQHHTCLLSGQETEDGVGKKKGRGMI